MHILTFDIEDWFRISSKFSSINNNKSLYYLSEFEKNLDIICRFLSENQFKATFFWLGKEAKRFPDLVRKIYDAGHEIGVHSYDHNRLNHTEKNKFINNTERAVKILEDITGNPITTYRAPGLSINKDTLWAFEILYNLGIKTDSSLPARSFTGSHYIPDNPFIINYYGVEIKEFPVSSFSILKHPFNFSSSGYFRIMPYWFLHKEIKKHFYTMSYFHPRDFDRNIHKLIKGNIYFKLKYRIGTKNAYHKLEKLSETITWISIENAMNQLKGKKLNILYLK